jgi:hypothetical protein
VVMGDIPAGQWNGAKEGAGAGEARR